MCEFATLESPYSMPVALHGDLDLTDPEAQTRSRALDRKSTRLNSSHRCTSYAVFCLKKKRNHHPLDQRLALHHLRILLHELVRPAPIEVAAATEHPNAYLALALLLPDDRRVHSFVTE